MAALLRALLFVWVVAGTAAFAQDVGQPAQALGAADVVKITVFQNPDLTLETRVSEAGQITYPLLGTVAVGGLSIADAEQKIARLLRDGGFVLKPQVNISVVQLRSAQVSVLGQVGRPGRYPIETVGSKVSEIVATAGGVIPGASDVVTLTGVRDGKPVRMTIDLPAILQSTSGGTDPVVVNGDTLFVDRAPVVYIYGEVQRPGVFRLERGMTVMQGLAQGGGLTPRGTVRGIRISRRNDSGDLITIDATLTDSLERDDVIVVRESLF